jgi:hypothetical protein
MSRGNQLQVPRNVDARAVHGPKRVHERQADEEPGQRWKWMSGCANNQPGFYSIGCLAFAATLLAFFQW